MTKDHPIGNERTDGTVGLPSKVAGQTPNSEFPATLTHTPVPSADVAGIPERIGEYKIVRKIGEGGMGTVYEAEQESPRRTVALKVIRAGLASTSLLKRFELESQVLGRLQHPGIGQIYQAGTADTDQGKQPYFAMEYVRGVSLRQHVEQKRLGTRECLDLLSRICDAVHHAHQKGVIHRDLKPGNILVDQSGQPKILDFGVARATDSDMQVTTMQTDVGQLIGTLQYMSPEQVAADPNDLDTRSDVYALGVIAYEMLAGHAPYDLKNKMIHEVARIIQEDEPTSLSSTNKTFRGDIETIVVKALEKDKERRYQSAAGLAEDIRRYLQDEPILARRQSAVYQLQKFAKRHKAVAGGLGIAMTALLIGTVTSTYLYLQADEARAASELDRKAAEESERGALAARDDSDSVVKFLSDMLASVDPGKDGKDVRVRQILDEAAKTVADTFIDKPLIEARLRGVIGSSYLSLGLFGAADPQLSASAAIFRRELGPTHRNTLASMNNLGSLLGQQGKFAGADKTFRKTYEITRRVLGEEHPDTLLSMSNLANVLYSQGRYAEAEKLYRRTLEIKRRVLGEEHPKTLTLMNNLANVLAARARYAEAEKLYRKTLDIERRVLGQEHPGTLVSMGNLANVLSDQGRYAEAEKLCRSTLEIKRRVLGEEHPDTLASINLANALLRQDRYAEAEKLIRQTLEIKRRVLGEEHPNTLMSMNNLATALLRQDRYAEAEKLWHQTLEIQRRVLGQEHPDTLLSMGNLANVLFDQGRYAEAEKLWHQTLEIQRRVLGEEHPNTLTSMNDLANALHSHGRYAEAEKLVRRALEINRRVLGDEHPDTLWPMGNLALVLGSQGRYAEAEKLYRQTLDIKRRVLGEEHRSTLLSTSNLAATLASLGDLDEAKRLYRETIEIARRTLGSEHPFVASWLVGLGEVLVAKGDTAEAKQVLHEGLAMQRNSLPENHPDLAISQSALGECLAALGQYAEAERLLLKSYERLAEVQGEAGYDSRKTLARIIKLYGAWHAAQPGEGYDDKADGWRARLSVDNAGYDK